MAFMPFLKDEAGAVTVDWVVLVAALIGLAFAVLTYVTGGTTDLAGEISSALEAIEPGTF